MSVDWSEKSDAALIDVVIKSRESGIRSERLEQAGCLVIAACSAATVFVVFFSAISLWALSLIPMLFFAYLSWVSHSSPAEHELTHRYAPTSRWWNEHVIGHRESDDVLLSIEGTIRPHGYTFRMLVVQGRFELRIMNLNWRKNPQNSLRKIVGAVPRDIDARLQALIKTGDFSERRFGDVVRDGIPISVVIHGEDKVVIGGNLAGARGDEPSDSLALAREALRLVTTIAEQPVVMGATDRFGNITTSNL